MDKLRALLDEMKADEYVRFKYGKRLDAAIKTLDAHAGLDARELESRLTELLDWTRGKKGGGPAGTRSKSRTPKEASKGKPHGVEA